MTGATTKFTKEYKDVLMEEMRMQFSCGRRMVVCGCATLRDACNVVVITEPVPGWKRAKIDWMLFL